MKRRKIPAKPNCRDCRQREECARRKSLCKDADRWSRQDEDRPKMVHVLTAEGKWVRVPRLVYEHQLKGDKDYKRRGG